MRIICLLVIITTCCFSCRKGYDHGEKKPLVEVDENFLYYEDLQAATPVGLSKDDSTLFAEHYIRSWVEDVLFSKKASDNIPDNTDIDRLVANYRNSLILHAYQQELISQKLSNEISDEDLLLFYNNNKELFKLEVPIIKAIYIKIPLTAPRINEVRKWCRADNPDAIDKLEKYSFQNAVKYEYLRDNWIRVTEISDWLPISISDLETKLITEKHLELRDSLYYYFLSVNDYRGKGQEEPFEFARKEVKDMVINTKQIDFIRDVKEDLYRQAIKRNKIKYNN